MMKPSLLSLKGSVWNSHVSVVPPYVVFNDRSLQEMAFYLPKKPARFLHYQWCRTC